MSGVNRVTLIGNLGRDPDVTTLESGVKVAKFSLATSETYKDKSGEKVTATEWHNIIAWRGLAEIIDKWVKKGQTIYIEGKITYRKYEDKDGNERKVTEIIASNMQMLGGGTRGEASQEDIPGDSNHSPVNSQPLEFSDDLPF